MPRKKRKGVSLGMQLTVGQNSLLDAHHIKGGLHPKHTFTKFPIHSCHTHSRFTVAPIPIVSLTLSTHSSPPIHAQTLSLPSLSPVYRLTLFYTSTQQPTFHLTLTPFTPFIPSCFSQPEGSVSSALESFFSGSESSFWLGSEEPIFIGSAYKSWERFFL